MKAQKLIELLEDKVHIIAAHDDYPKVAIVKRLIELASQEDQMIQLIYPDKKKVPASKIIGWAQDAFADGDIDHAPKDIWDAIDMLQDIGKITVAKNELYNGPAWNASQPGAAGPGAMTQTIPEQEGDYIATKQGMKKGYWKVMNIKTGDTVQSGITTKSVADGIAQKWNQGYYKSIRDVQGSHESKVEEERTPMVCQECGHKFKKTMGKGTFEVKCPKCGSHDTDVE